MDRQLVVFELADEYYAVDIHRVESIIKMQDITSVPHAPVFVDGVINLRGEVLPVVDLRCRFGLEEREETRETRIVVVAIDDMKVGMIVDGVSEVLNINTEEVEPPSPMVTTVDSGFIEGIAKEDNRLIILVDLAKVLTVEETRELEGMPN
ncbi:MAG: purine-binding chemotaxis protein CheW [Anaerolineales bacterium]|nr:purine-binding chemotaxis protein CheW [Anaerolineales bacterium]